ncbi:YibE/F family protein [Patescibacteria group bacterium]|nr:YibE/F family protein [Patescibacteria group bacterium]
MKKIKIILISIIFLLPFSGFAQSLEGTRDANISEVFKAKIVEVLEEKVISLENGGKIIQQNLKLRGLSGKWEDKEFEYKGINDIQAINSQQYKAGDKLIINYSLDSQEEEMFLIVDKERTNSLYWLVILFIVLIIIVGGFKGLKSLISLAVTMMVILWFIVPRIFQGANPILISIIGGAVIVFLVIYLTEGRNQKSYLTVISIYLSLIITGFLSWFFIKIAALSGTASEEIMFLVDSSKVVDFRGLLLAGIILGAIGVLDDLVISQLATVEEIKRADHNLTVKEVYKRAKRVGVSHLASMTNTLFLAYVGVALPLLLLFYIKQPPFMTIGQVLNSEIIATEIVRTLVGSIGLISAMPISTWIAAKYLKIKS